MSLLNRTPSTLATALGVAAAASDGGTTDRPVSDFWLNIGHNVPNPDPEAAEGEEFIFVGLPKGLALDDMKPVQVKGNNKNRIQLDQAKNALLELLQKGAANLKPGERREIPLVVQIYRRAEPEQQGSQVSNPLVASLVSALTAQ